MTEEQWLACASCSPMLAFLTYKASQRKLRLFAVACCRRVWHLLPDPNGTNAVEVAERLVDGLATNAERRAVAVDSAPQGAASWVVRVHAYEAALGAARHSASARAGALAVPGSPHWDRVRDGELSAQASLLRDLFGRLPFRTAAPDPSCLTLTVLAIATAIYEERTYRLLPILGDALEEAGCTDADLLAHLRSPGPHVRGCWALDLVLGKS